ncbi:hypothetical protein NIES4073_01200 (plasmid) [Kalymmatonema gypsitolerans NIES-4073]|nr:hypothetical protein NIES22_37250 [Calothrix brevissima NIES-22]BAZ19250.1 hypothetical protein NIES4073_01200 [Scytonema sp. NIES-4073]
MKFRELNSQSIRRSLLQGSYLKVVLQNIAYSKKLSVITIKF